MRTIFTVPPPEWLPLSYSHEMCDVPYMFHSSDSPLSQDLEDPIRFTPHPMPPRAGGWSAERQIAFIVCLRRIGVVAAAARSVGMGVRSAYQLRDRAGPDSSFARAWAAALDEGRMRAVDEIVARGFGARRVPMLRHGRQVGWREVHDNRLLFAALRALDGGSTRFEAAQGCTPEAHFHAGDRRNNVARRRNGIARSP
jgi:hypothetical protein